MLNVTYVDLRSGVCSFNSYCSLLVNKMDASEIGVCGSNICSIFGVCGFCKWSLWLQYLVFIALSA